MNYLRIPFVGRTPPGITHGLEGLPMKIARIPVANLPPGVPGLVRWIKAAHPTIYRSLGARLAVARPVRLAGLGLASPSDDLSEVKVNVTKIADSAPAGSSIANTILSTVKDLVTVGLPLYQQQKVFDLQLSRAKAGLAPLDTQALSDASALRVGVDSGTRNTGLMIAGILAVGGIAWALLRRAR